VIDRTVGGSEVVFGSRVAVHSDESVSACQCRPGRCIRRIHCQSILKQIDSSVQGLVVAPFDIPERAYHHAMNFRIDGAHGSQRRTLAGVERDAHRVRHSHRHRVFHVEEIGGSVELIGPQHPAACHVDQLQVNAHATSLTLELAEQHLGCVQPAPECGWVVVGVVARQLARRFDRDDVEMQRTQRIEDGQRQPLTERRLRCVEHPAKFVGSGGSLRRILLESGEHGITEVCWNVAPLIAGICSILGITTSARRIPTGLAARVDLYPRIRDSESALNRYGGNIPVAEAADLRGSPDSLRAVRALSFHMIDDRREAAGTRCSPWRFLCDEMANRMGGRLSCQLRSQGGA